MAGALLPGRAVIKTPIAMPALVAGGLVLWDLALAAAPGSQDALRPAADRRLRQGWRRGSISACAITPIPPLLLLGQAAAAKALLDRGRASIVPAALALGASSLAATILTTAFFNALVGGLPRGSWHLSTRISWGQDLKPLKAWMMQPRSAHQPRISAPRIRPKERRNALAGSAFFQPGANEYSRPRRERHALRGKNFGDQERVLQVVCQPPFPVASIGHSIFVLG